MSNINLSILDILQLIYSFEGYMKSLFWIV